MRILYSTSVIASDTLAVGRVAHGLVWNSEPVLDIVGFFRDGLHTVYARSDGPESIAFNVWALFATEGEAMYFCGTHRSSLPLQADFLIYDTAAGYALRLANAARTVNIVQRAGLAVLIQYRFTGRQFVSEDAPEANEVTYSMKLGAVSPASGVEEIVVTYSTPADSVARYCHLTLQPPPGSPAVEVVGTKDETESGFTAVLSAALPASGYTGRYLAIFADADSDTAKYGAIAADAGDEEIVVEYGSPFGFAPRYFHLWLQTPTGQPAVAVVGYKDISASGFTAILGAALPASGYVGRFAAFL